MVNNSLRFFGFKTNCGLHTSNEKNATFRFRNYQYGGDGMKKDLLSRMDSDDSDSELDIETSTTPDNVSLNDGASSDGRSGKADLIKPDLGSPNSNSGSVSDLMHNGGNGGSGINITSSLMSGTTITTPSSLGTKKTRIILYCEKPGFEFCALFD